MSDVSAGHSDGRHRRLRGHRATSGPQIERIPATKTIAAFDIGTTAVKAVIVAEDGTLSHAREIGIRTQHGPAGEVEQSPADWYDAVGAVSAAWWAAGLRPQDVAAIALSGQMQDVIPLAANGAPARAAILYSDTRAQREADAVRERFASAALARRLGHELTAASLLPKLLWLREREPAVFAATRRILVGSKDYVISELTGAQVTDPTTASTTGWFDLQNDCWDHSLSVAYAFSETLLPEVHAAGRTVGTVTANAAARTGFTAGTPVLCGLGDAAATTVGSGVTQPGESYLYLGTTGWLAHVAPLAVALADPVATVFTLAGVSPGEAIRVAPVLNAGNVLTWALGLLGWSEGEDVALYLERFEDEVARSDDSGDLLFVPYLGPERCPVADVAPNGALLGLTARTSRAQILRAILEGTAFSLRWCAELLHVDLSRPIRAVGGGTRSRAWLQAIADGFDTCILAPADGGLLPVRGVGAVAAAALGWATSPGEFLARGAPAADVTAFHPAPRQAALLQRKYEAFSETVRRVGLLRRPAGGENDAH